MIEVAPKPDHLAVLEVDHGGWGESVSARSPATGADASDRDDAVAQVADLRVLLVGLAQSLVHVSDRLAEALVSSIHRRLASQPREDPRVPLHLGVELLQQRVDVSAVSRLDPALEGIHVLLRHRPRSISRRGGRVATSTA